MRFIAFVLAALAVSSAASAQEMEGVRLYHRGLRGGLSGRAAGRKCGHVSSRARKIRSGKYLFVSANMACSRSRLRMAAMQVSKRPPWSSKP